MTAVTKTRLLVAAVTAAGIAAAALAVRETHRGDLRALALFAAATVLTELLYVKADRSSPFTADGHAFTFSSAIYVAAALALGPGPATIVAVSSFLLVQPLRRMGWQQFRSTPGSSPCRRSPPGTHLSSRAASSVRSTSAPTPPRSSSSC